MKRVLERIREVAAVKIIYTEHTLNEMNTENEIISPKEVREVIFEGEVIEDYPGDKRGHSCLMRGYTSRERVVHIVCSPKEEYLGIITAYVPTLDRWEEDFKMRRSK